jgi:Xaa-Pro aminopeptidase
MEQVYRERLNDLRLLLAQEGVDAIIVFSSRFDSSFIRWATGITCQSAFHYLYITPDAECFAEISYRAHELRLKTSIPINLIPEESDGRDTINTLTKEHERIGLIGSAPFSHLADVRHKIVDLSHFAEEKLLTKSEPEIREIGNYAEALRNAIISVGKTLRVGESEREIANTVAQTLCLCSDRLACPTSVISGSRLAATTVGPATDSLLDENYAVLIDAATVTNGLYADCTRMFFSSAHPSRIQYEALYGAHKQAISKLTPGLTGKHILKIYQHELDKAGLPFETLTIQDLGHGIGFTLHEQPYFCTASSDRFELRPGMVFTLEPEITVANMMLRIEDMLVVSGNGKILNLTCEH